MSDEASAASGVPKVSREGVLSPTGRSRNILCLYGYGLCPSLSAYSCREFQEFARRYGEKWREIKVGKRDNGVIILIVLDQQRVTIGVGQNLKGILTDRVLQDIIQHVIIPEVREIRYADGIKKAAEKIMDIVGKADIPTGNPYLYHIIVGVVIVMVCFLAFRGIKDRAKS